jgi:hypothetical protein
VCVRVCRGPLMGLHVTCHAPTSALLTRSAPPPLLPSPLAFANLSPLPSVCQCACAIATSPHSLPPLSLSSLASCHFCRPLRSTTAPVASPRSRAAPWCGPRSVPATGGGAGRSCLTRRARARRPSVPDPADCRNPALAGSGTRAAPPSRELRLPSPRGILDPRA